jgi:exo-beta-1,3-glucanase (GH17 family)
LHAEAASLSAATGVPITTSEPKGQYDSNPTLLQLGDWVFPNIHPWFAAYRTPPDAARFVRDQVGELEALAPGRAVIVKEAWWPTGGGDPAATEPNQTSFLRELSHTSVRFVWGEAFDQYWKTQEGPQGPHWGFHTDIGAPKNIIPGLRYIYTGPY